MCEFCDLRSFLLDKVHLTNLETFTWLFVAILWNDLTIDWNDLTMERNVPWSEFSYRYTQ